MELASCLMSVKPRGLEVGNKGYSLAHVTKVPQFLRRFDLGLLFLVLFEHFLKHVTGLLSTKSDCRDPFPLSN